MPRDPRVYLLDAITAGQLIERFVAGKTLDDYQSDAMLHSAVERQFEIIGVRRGGPFSVMHQDDRRPEKKVK
jgi:uncharacterized protein with HEPN domain